MAENFEALIEQAKQIETKLSKIEESKAEDGEAVRGSEEALGTAARARQEDARAPAAE